MINKPFDRIEAVCVFGKAGDPAVQEPEKKTARLNCPKCGVELCLYPSQLKDIHNPEIAAWGCAECVVEFMKSLGEIQLLGRSTKIDTLDELREENERARNFRSN